MFRPFLAEPPKEPIDLPEHGSWPRARHQWSEDEMRALAAAGLSGRPLLVKGEPGAGKSQLARAAAAMLDWRFEYEVITPRFEPQSLLWKFDTVRRLADWNKGLQRDEDYTLPGVLWRALDPWSAASVRGEDSHSVAGSGCVVLIDEIDKADSDLPNSLLEVLGNRSFKTNLAGPSQVVPNSQGSKNQGMLIVVTSNNERELPPAFMRRCVVLEINVPKDGGKFIDWLATRGRAQFPCLDSDIVKRTAEMVLGDRQRVPAGQGTRPGLAEFIDLLKILDEVAIGMAADEAKSEQGFWLKKLNRFVLRKVGQLESE